MKSLHCILCGPVKTFFNLLLVTVMIFPLSSFSKSSLVEKKASYEEGIYETSCTNDSPALCIAAGYVIVNDGVSKKRPLLKISVDGGITWKEQLIPGIETAEDLLLQDSLTATYCHGRYNKSFCFAIGRYSHNGIIVHSSGGLTNWQLSTLPDPRSHWGLHSVECTKSLIDDIPRLCVASGYSNEILQSFDGGRSWSIQSTCMWMPTGWFSIDNCDQTGCLLKGAALVDVKKGIFNEYIAETHDFGNTWLCKEIDHRV